MDSWARPGRSPRHVTTRRDGSGTVKSKHVSRDKVRPRDFCRAGKREAINARSSSESTHTTGYGLVREGRRYEAEGRKPQAQAERCG